MSTTTSVVSATQSPRPQFTIEQLQAAQWKCTNINVTHDEISPGFDPSDEEDMHLYEPPQSCVAGYATITASLENLQPLTIEFSWQASGKNDGTLAGLYDFSMAFEEQNDFGIKVNFDLVDEDGDIIKVSTSNYEIGEFLNNLGGYVWCNEALSLCPDAPRNETVGEIEENMELITVNRDNAALLEFNGELIAHVESSSNNASGSNYSGSTGRYQKLYLYKTKGGKFICERIDVTQWQGERDRHFAEVCATEQDVINFFGQKWLAKDLYYAAKIKNVETID